MMTSISTPTSLATFQTAHASSSKLQHVSLSEVELSGSKLAVAAVQGDGVWTYDLQTLRPTTSFTVPPSTSFSSRPLSFVPTVSVSGSGAGPKGQSSKGQTSQTNTKTNEKSKANEDDMEVDEPDSADQNPSREPLRVTAVGVVPQGKDLPAVWIWEGEEGAEKRVIKLDHSSPVHSLHHLSSPSFPILCVSSTSEVSLLDSSFAPHRKADGDSTPLLATRVVDSSPESSLLVVVDARAQVVVQRIQHHGETVSAKEMSTGVLVSLQSSRSLVAAEISETGIITAIDTLGLVISRDIKDLRSPSGRLPRYLSTPPHPCLLPLPSKGQPLVLLPSSAPAAILLTTPSPEVASILSESPLSSLSPSGSISQLAILARPTPNSFIIGFVVLHSHSDGESGRSIIYTCEVTVPAKGVGLNALLGTQARTAKYFSTAREVEPAKLQRAAGAGAGASDREARCEAIVNEIEAALSTSASPEGSEANAHERASKAEAIWSEWIGTESEQWEGEGKMPVPEASVRRLVNVIFSAALPSHADEGVSQSETTTDAPVVLRSGPYAAGIMRDLLARRALSDGLWNGGVVAAGLLPCCDWGNITRALRVIPTVSSATLLVVLRTALHPPSHPGLPGPPPFSHIYRDVLSLPTPPSTFRLELRRSLTTDEATSLLACLVDWAEMHVEARSFGLSKWDSSKKDSSTTPSPSLESVIAHSSLLLDAHLPNFLSHPPSYTLIERLQAALDPLVAVQNEFRQLRAPVEAVLTLAKREERRREERREKKEAMRPVSVFDGKKGGKGEAKKGEKEKQVAHLPSEAVGKWRVEDIAF
ncbi:hypothetical protein JCM24511_03450 [Saitozyma sp. JCM 24511]|nr:hypothetical protein JCM24511_03450 [Saitozyma sp. JCM 24511]